MGIKNGSLGPKADSVPLDHHIWARWLGLKVFGKKVVARKISRDHFWDA